jgi:hypothetical protein
MGANEEGETGSRTKGKRTTRAGETGTRVARMDEMGTRMGGTGEAEATGIATERRARNERTNRRKRPSCLLSLSPLLFERFLEIFKEDG